MDDKKSSIITSRELELKEAELTSLLLGTLTPNR
jgi:hypothetical protein